MAKVQRLKRTANLWRYISYLEKLNNIATNLNLNNKEAIASSLRSAKRISENIREMDSNVFNEKVGFIRGGLIAYWQLIIKEVINKQLKLIEERKIKGQKFIEDKQSLKKILEDSGDITNPLKYYANWYSDVENYAEKIQEKLEIEKYEFMKFLFGIVVGLVLGVIASIIVGIIT